MFDLNHKPEIGVAEMLAPGLRVVTAPNASPMTYTGTRSYLLGESELAILDPGPDDPAHYAALLAAIKGQRVSHIIVTHSHIDHSPLAKRLSRAVDAPILGFGPSHAGRSATMEKLAKQGGLAGGEGIDADFMPDIFLKDGDRVFGAEWQLKTLHTPGHLSNHLCFDWEGGLFSGDHVMGWSTTLVSPPDGDLTQFMTSMKKLGNHNADLYFPGHGAPLTNAKKMLEHQISHRLHREEQVLTALFDGHSEISALTVILYADIDQALWPMAARNVLAHIIDLIGRGLVKPVDALQVDGQFQLV
ncbi:MAG: MBL fold metallo-hydrolase [Rhodobacteraceae bacterium]|nr:MBL fold metallo-hydrolase [Paracoccaceae bacterium]